MHVRNIQMGKKLEHVFGLATNLMIYALKALRVVFVARSFLKQFEYRFKLN